VKPLLQHHDDPTHNLDFPLPAHVDLLARPAEIGIRPCMQADGRRDEMVFSV
jgi:hypothetical protein